MNELIDCCYLRLCTCTRPVHVHRRVLHLSSNASV